MSAVWYWKAHLRLPDHDEAAWQAYGDGDQQRLEQAYQSDPKSRKFMLSNTWAISFYHMSQYRAEQPKRRRRIRRVLDGQVVPRRPPASDSNSGANAASPTTTAVTEPATSNTTQVPVPSRPAHTTDTSVSGAALAADLAAAPSVVIPPPPSAGTQSSPQPASTPTSKESRDVWSPRVHSPYEPTSPGPCACEGSGDVGTPERRACTRCGRPGVCVRCGHGRECARCLEFKCGDCAGEATTCSQCQRLLCEDCVLTRCCRHCNAVHCVDCGKTCEDENTQGSDIEDAPLIRVT